MHAPRVTPQRARPCPLRPQAAAQPASPSAARPTAVLYVHWADGPDAEANLELFVRAGVGREDNVQYRILLATPAPLPQAALPALPPNARYVQLEGGAACNASVWGAIGAARERLGLDPWAALVVASSRAVGPLLPPYVRQVRTRAVVCWRVLLSRAHAGGTTLRPGGAQLAGGARPPPRLPPRPLRSTCTGPRPSPRGCLTLSSWWAAS